MRFVAVEVVRDPQVQVVEGGTVLGLRLQQLAVLGLAAGALEEHHQFPGNLQRHFTAAVGFDQRQRQIDAGADARRCPH